MGRAGGGERVEGRGSGREASLNAHRGLGSSVCRSRHFGERAALRHIEDEVVDFVLAWGTCFFRSGVVFQTVQERRLPRELRNSRIARRAMGWVLCLAHDGLLLTGYFRRDAIHSLRVKPKQALSWDQWRRRSLTTALPQEGSEEHQMIEHLTSLSRIA